MPFDFDQVPVKPIQERVTAQRLRELLEPNTLFVANKGSDYTAERLPPLTDDHHDDQMDAMSRGIDWGDPAGDRIGIIGPTPRSRQLEPIMQTLRVTYLASTTDGEITDTYDLLTHRRYVRTITETLREIGNHINRIYISGPRYGTVRCIERFLEALRAVTYLKGQCLMSITEISIL